MEYQESCLHWNFAELLERKGSLTPSLKKKESSRSLGWNLKSGSFDINNVCKKACKFVG